MTRTNYFECISIAPDTGEKFSVEIQQTSMSTWTTTVRALDGSGRAAARTSTRMADAFRDAASMRLPGRAR